MWVDSVNDAVLLAKVCPKQTNGHETLGWPTYKMPKVTQMFFLQLGPSCGKKSCPGHCLMKRSLK